MQEDRPGHLTWWSLRHQGLASRGPFVSCEGDLAILQIDKNTGVGLGVHGTLTATGLRVIAPGGLSSLTATQ